MIVCIMIRMYRYTNMYIMLWDIDEVRTFDIKSL